MNRRNYFLAVMLAAIFVEFGAVAVWIWTFVRHAGPASGAVLAMIGTYTPFVGVMIALAPIFFGAGSKRPSATPRIENLRIAGKYSGKPAAMGTTPLDLRF